MGEPSLDRPCGCHFGLYVASSDLEAKASYRATIFGYKDLWKTIADLQQGLKGWGQQVTLRFFNTDSMPEDVW